MQNVHWTALSGRCNKPEHQRTARLELSADALPLRLRWPARFFGKVLAFALILGSISSPRVTEAAADFLQISNRYFWDPSVGDYFVPRGVAYQVWNPPVGANQSTNQVNYDLVEFKKMHANSVRAEFTWGQVEIAPNQFDWTRPDYLVQRAEALGLKLFIIIGYQYPPSWFPPSWRGSNNLGLREDVLNCLAKSSPSNALSCLPPRTAGFLVATNSAGTLSQVLNCLVIGANEGGLSNVLTCLQSTLTQDQLDANLPYLLSDVINYENPQAQAAYSNYISTVTARYKDSPAIGAWILGNEYAYFDLWEDNKAYSVHRFLGYDPLSQQSFRNYLQSHYQTNIATLNANWQTNYTNFDSVVMPLEYPYDRYYPGYQDLLQWRKQSIANYVASGALAARLADPNHLRTYSMVGGIFSGLDANYTCEDAKTIVATCSAAGAPLDFWSINNYAWAFLGSELRSAAYGIGKYQAQSGLPVMISETGHSSTETLFDVDANGYSFSGARQPKALPSTMWESLLAGAIGVHFFDWNDRSLFTQGYDYRERGFGIVQEDRLPKTNGVYENMVALFRQLENIRLDHLLGGSTNPPPDVQYFWSTNADMVWPRANQENAMTWGALKRLGLQPGMIDDAGFEAGAFTNAPALLLSRCFQMDPLDLQRVATDVTSAGIHVHAEADLPGQFDAYDRPNPNWAGWMDTAFGVNVTGASLGLDTEVTNDCYGLVGVQGVTNLGPLTTAYTADFLTWKLWRNVAPLSARSVLQIFGYSFPSSACSYLDVTPYPALLLNSRGANYGKTAVNVFALGDTFVNNMAAEPGLWDTRSAILQAIYLDHFGLKPTITLTGSGSGHVSTTYRICANGSVLLALLNEDTNTAVVTISAPALLAGRTVEDLFQGAILSRNSTGTLTYTNQGDNCVVLYAYSPNQGQDNSLINPNPNKLWFQSAPSVIWPALTPFDVGVAYDALDANLNLSVSLERIEPRQTVYAQTMFTNLSGTGSVLAQLLVPDADPNNPNYVSSPEGGQYVFRAFFSQAGVVVSELTLPVRLVFGVHPTQPFPSVLVPGQTYPIELAWEELPSYAPGDVTPLDRAAQWDSDSLGQEHYSIVLELMNSSGSIVASNAFLTSSGTGINTFSVTVPAGAVGPFTWNAFLQTATNVLSHNVLESFEGYQRGAKWQGPNLPFLTNVNFLAPWFSFVYPTNTTIWLNEGVQLLGSDGSQSAFIVATNPASVAVATFGMIYQFPTNWALPTDLTQWSNFVFSYDFMESQGYSCSVEMQIKDANSNWIQFVPTNLYGGSNNWFTVKASLDEFQPPPPGETGPFDSNHVSDLVLNIRMLTPGVVYVGSFDNIRFTAPEINFGGGQTTSFYTSANDSIGWLSIEPQGDGVSVSWVGTGVLESAAEVEGPWLEITNASSPYLVPPLSTRQFFRLHR